MFCKVACHVCEESTPDVLGLYRCDGCPLVFCRSCIERCEHECDPNRALDSKRRQAELLDTLNAWLEAAPETVQAIVDSRHWIDGVESEALSKLRGVVGTYHDSENEGRVSLGPLGLINSLLEGHEIAAVYDDARLSRFIPASEA